MTKRKIDTIVIHCSATPVDRAYTFLNCERDHIQRGFRKCGYHFFIRQDGTVHVGRELSEIGAHAGKGYNVNSVGICYEGGIVPMGNPSKPKDAKDTRTEAQKKSMLDCIAKTIAFSEDKITTILGHRDLSPDLNGNGIVEPKEWIKICPCFDAKAEYKHLISNA